MSLKSKSDFRIVIFQWNFRFYGPAQSRSYFLGEIESVVTGERQVSELNKSLLLYIAQILANSKDLKCTRSGVCEDCIVGRRVYSLYIV